MSTSTYHATGVLEALDFTQSVFCDYHPDLLAAWTAHAPCCVEPTIGYCNLCYLVVSNPAYANDLVSCEECENEFLLKELVWRPV